jgi:hypothetical protein
MTLTHSQKLATLFLSCTLLLGYVYANVRHTQRAAAIAEQLEREASLHDSINKLLVECAKESARKSDRFGVERKVCDQGKEAHERNQQRIGQLEIDQAQNQRRWYINWLVSVLLLNGLGYVSVRMYRFFNV